VIPITTTVPPAAGPIRTPDPAPQDVAGPDDVTGIPPALTAALAAFARQERRTAMWRGWAEAALVAAGALAVGAANDAWLHPSYGARCWVALGGAVVVSATVAWRVGLPWWRGAPPVAVARALEAAAAARGKGLDQRLSAAIELAGKPVRGVSAWMVGRTLALAAQEAAALAPSALIDALPGRKAWRRSAAAGLVLALALAVPGVPTFYLRALWPPANLERPSRVKLTVDGGDRLVAEGAAMDLAVAAAPDPGAAVAELRWDDGAVERLDMVAGAGSTPGRYTAHLGAVTRGFTYDIVAGDGETRRYDVRTAPPPRVDRVELRVRPPAYTGLPPHKHAGGDLEIVAGSTVTITAVLAGEPAVAAALVCEGGEGNAAVEQAARILPVGGDGMGAVQATLTPTASMTWHLRLVGANGLRAETAERWQLAVVPDRAPTATLTVPGGLPPGGTVALDEPLALAVTGTDDLGLATLDLEIATAGGTPIRHPIDLPAGPAPQLRAESTLALDPSAYGLAPGDHVVVTAVATDRGGQEGRSAPLDLAVAARSDGDLAAAAERLRAARARLADAAAELSAIAKAWNGLGHDQPGDELAWRGDMLLLRERAATWTSDISGIAADTAQGAADSAGNADSAAAAAGLAAIARTLGAWGTGIGGQLDVEAAAALAAPSALPQARARAMAVADAAGRDLDHLSTDLSALGLGADTAALALRAHDAGARAARALVLLRGDVAWRETAWQPGLAGDFFNGIALAGDPVWRTVGAPDFESLNVPGIGLFNFSARYTGEVQVAEDGDWVFRATADDGVRLSIDGNALLPAQAWVQQAPTPWSGTIHLAQGWHALVLEYYQGPGGSHLDLAMAHPGQPLVQIPLDHLRSRHAGDALAAAVTAAMVKAVPAAVAQAEARADASWTTLAQVPAALDAAAAAGGGDPLRQLSAAATAPAATLAAMPPRASWTMATLDGAGAAATTVAGAAAQAPAMVAGVVANAVNAEPDPGPLPELRIAISAGAALIARADQVAADPGDRAARGRALSGAASWAGEIARAAVVAADALADATGCDAPARLERAAAIRNLSQLQDMALAEQSVVNAAARHAELHLGVAGPALAPQRQPAWAAMQACLKNAEDAVIAAGAREDAALARTALAAATSATAAQAADGDATLAQAIAGSNGRRLAELARLRRDHGDPAAAVALAHLAAAAGPIDPGTLTAALGMAVAQPAPWLADATLITARSVRDAGQRIARLVPLPPDPGDAPIIDNSLTAVAFTCSDGATLWGHFGVMRGHQEITFIGDDLPAKAVPDGGNDGWTWTTDTPPPNGRRAHAAKYDAGIHQHLIAVPVGTMPVQAGDVFFIDVRPDAAKPPQEMLVQLQLNGDWNHRASWGGDNLAALVSLHVGAVPEGGQWARLEVPVEALGFALDPEHPPAPFFADGEEVAPSAPVTPADKAHARNLEATAQKNDARSERERRERATAATAAHLATAAAALVLVAEGERRRGDGRSDQAPAFNAVAREAGALAAEDPPTDANGESETAQDLRVLAKKIADLANKPARSATTAIAAADPATRLQGLAKDAHDAATNHDQRPALQAELAQAAQAAPATATTDRAAATGDLRAAITQAEAADAGERAARTQAAANAEALAKDLDAFANKATQDAAATGDPQSRTALTAAAAAAKTQSAEATALATALQQDPANAGAAPTPALATRTDADANAIATGVAAPLAVASQGDQRSADDGRAAAELAARTQDSAAALAASEARRVAAQKRLAEATAQAAAAAGAGDPGAAQVAADAATANAVATSQTAATAWAASAANPQDANALNAAHGAQDIAMAAQNAAVQAQAAAAQTGAAGSANGATGKTAENSGKNVGGPAHDPVAADAAQAAAAGGDAADLAAGSARMAAAAGNAAAGGGDAGAAAAARKASDDAAGASLAAEPHLEAAARALAKQLADAAPATVAGNQAAAGQPNPAMDGGTADAHAADAGPAPGAGADPTTDAGAAAGPDAGATAHGDAAAPGAAPAPGQGAAAAGQGDGPAAGKTAGAGQGAGKAGKGAGAGAPAGGDAVADPARQALAMIAANPADDGSYRNAAATLDAAAAAARMDGAAGAAGAPGAAGAAAGAPGQGAAAANSGKGGPGGRSGPGPSKGSANTPGGSAAGLASNPGGSDHPDWARLSDQSQRNVRSEGVDHFSVEHQEAIRAYLQRLAEGK
jgi:hypothetical protein